MATTRVLVLAGGQSEEHEVSLTSARSLLDAVEGTPIAATTVVITRAGKWLTPAESRKALTDGKATSGGDSTLRRAQVTEGYDVVFPLIHGPMGEDGTLQGMLELANIPYVGSGVLASSLCMDKVMCKAVLRDAGIPQINSELITRHEFTRDRAAAIARCAPLGPIWFVKPANMGSSVGVSRATDETQLIAGIEEALRFDRRVIVDHGLTNVRELEVAILGNDEPVASSIGEITFDSDFYTYETKYTDGRAGLHVPADIPPELVTRIQNTGLRAFQVLDCAGLARVDFFYRAEDDRLFLNEVNTMPGFTPLSMYAQLWEHAGVPYAELVQRLVEFALLRNRDREMGRTG